MNLVENVIQTAKITLKFIFHSPYCSVADAKI